MQYVNQFIAGILSVLVATLVLCGICGYFSSFVPSQLMVTVTVWSASVMGLVSAAFYGGFGAFGWHPGQQTVLSASCASLSHKRVKLPEKRYLRALLMGATVFGLTWLSLGSGPPLLLTMMFGHSGEMRAVVDGWTPRTGRTCLHPTLLHVPPLMMNEHTLCTDDRVKAGLPPRTSIRVIGRVSTLGVIPDAIQQLPKEEEERNN
jgi:hypothetical protein